MSKSYECLGPEGWGNYEIDFLPGQIEYRRVVATADALLVPAFVDLHIHGAYGIDFMSASHDELLTLCRALERDGYDLWLPTTVTATPGEVLSALGQLPAHPTIAGFHLEGPFISDRYPGAQPQDKIAKTAPLDPAWDEILDHPKLRVVTLAPEIPGAGELILRLQSRGVIVSMGHTNATFAEARAGFEFGITQATHTFNAMRPFHHREAGTVGYVLQQDGIVGELIYDRIHVATESAQLLLSCKPEQGVVAVSDSSMATGLAPGTKITMWGHECVCGRGEVRLADGTLAGSAQTLFDMFRNLFDDFGPEVAVRCCSLNPRRQLGIGTHPRTMLELDRHLQLVRRIPC